MLRSGELKQRIELQCPTKRPDGVGGFVTSYNTICVIWAAIWPLSAADVLEGMKLSAQITHRIRIRYRKNVISSMRVKFENRYFSIMAPPINPNMKNEMLDLVCKEVA